MSYIGKTPTIGNFQVCDAISVVNGQAAYTMQVNSVNVVPESANHMLVSLNGILQKPGGSFTVSGSTITFASNLATGDVIDFITLLGNVLDLGTPSDATVTNAKTNFVSTSSAAGLQIKGDGTTDGTLQLNCSQNSHGIKLKSPAHSASASYTLTFPTTDGNANEFLQSNGSGVLTWAEAGGGAWVLLNTQTITGGSTPSSVESGAVFSSTYDTYVIVVRRFRNSAGGGFRMQIGDSSSYVTSGYKWSGSGVKQGSSLVTGSSSDSYLEMLGGSGSSYHVNSSQDCLGGVIWIHNPFNSARTQIHAELAWENATGTECHINNFAGHPATDASYDRWKLYPSTGTWRAETIFQTFGVVNA